MAADNKPTERNGYKGNPNPYGPPPPPGVWSPPPEHEHTAKPSRGYAPYAAKSGESPPPAPPPDRWTPTPKSHVKLAGDSEDEEPGMIGSAFESFRRSRTVKRSLTIFWTAAFLLIIPVLTVIVLAAVPWTRYYIAALFLRQTITVEVVDSTTNQPVTRAQVSVGGASARTDLKGIATLRAKVGDQVAAVSKKYYSSGSAAVLVPIGKPHSALSIKLTPNGTEVPVAVANTISGSPVPNVLIRVADTDALTNDQGHVNIVLPNNSSKSPAAFSANNYNDKSSVIQVTDQETQTNAFQLTPAGEVYFLSKNDNKIDVLKANLDGSNRKTVLAGTGFEDPSTTELMGSSNWKFIALESGRDDSGKAKLYLIDTTNFDRLSIIDGTNATYNLIGWTGDTFIYLVAPASVANNQPGGQRLMAYNAKTQKLTTLDQTQGEGTGQSGYDYDRTVFNNVYIINGHLIYTAKWLASQPEFLAGKAVSLYSISPDGTDKKDVEDFAVPTDIGQYSSYAIGINQYAPQSLYVQNPIVHVPNGIGSSYYTFNDGKLTPTQISDDTFNALYPTYLISPSGKQTFWSQPTAGGKNQLLIGNVSGNIAKQIAGSSLLTPYGWFTDNYLLASDKTGILYIIPVSGVAAGTPYKLTASYFRPNVTHVGGYRYGNGGQ